MPRVGVTVIIFAVVVWAYCGALVGIGRQFMSMDATLIVHAIGAPIGSAAAAWLYFTKFGDVSPLKLAVSFVTISLLLDFFVVAMLIEKNFVMFSSIIGVWIPQILIFTAAYATGRLMVNGSGQHR